MTFENKLDVLYTYYLSKFSTLYRSCVDNVEYIVFNCRYIITIFYDEKYISYDTDLYLNDESVRNMLNNRYKTKLFNTFNISGFSYSKYYSELDEVRKDILEEHIEELKII